MPLGLVIGLALAYISLLFFIAWWIDKRSVEGKRLFINNPYVYALSMAVYCTAWTFFGSVGRAATGGLSFLAIYLGPTLFMPLWYMLLQKMVLISKNQHITSIADFISARYSKSQSLAVMVTIMAVFGIVPYISLQLKAVTFGINTLTHFGEKAPANSLNVLTDSGFWVAIAMTIFTAVFGTRKLDPNERHEGMVAAIAFESILKLLVFIAVGVFVTFFLFSGPGDLFTQAMAHPQTAKLFTLEDAGVTPLAWNLLCLLSLLAIIVLPRQFHISVVENTATRHIPRAIWVFPLYLLLINIFVFPLALAGKMLFDPNVNPDTYVLSLPMSQGANWLALLVFIGGFSAATSMVVVEATALSIMFSNHIVVPLMIKTRTWSTEYRLVDGAARLLDIRRICILVVMALSYWYGHAVGHNLDLVSVGLISFTAVAQLAPSLIGGMYWKRPTRAGALAGMSVGFIIWAFCLPVPNMAQAGILPSYFIENGLFGVSFLRPDALFGLEGLDPVTHAAFWSLLLNTLTYGLVSVFTQPSMLTLTQADIFVNIHKYIDGQEAEILKREAKVTDLRVILNRFLGEHRTEILLSEYETANGISLRDQKIARADLVNFAETYLAGAIGAASARLVMDSIVKEEVITLDEVMSILQQTKEAVDHSRMMESKNEELKELTRQLTEANEQLKHLDRLKADFITTVTHELRTPVTSIKSLSRIILDYNDELDKEQRSEYLSIIATESDRISRLINQVLDIGKIQSQTDSIQFREINLTDLVVRATSGIRPLCREKNVNLVFSERFQSLSSDNQPPVMVLADWDKMMQVLVNLLSNALKFCNQADGRIEVDMHINNNQVCVCVRDNGEGIDASGQDMIFEKFTQLHSRAQGKPQGTGLGLYISRMIVEKHAGTLTVRSEPGAGAAFEFSLPVI